MSIFKLLKKKQPKFEDSADSITTPNHEETMIENRPDPIFQMMAGISDNPDKAAMKTYDIIVFEPNADGTTKQTTMNGVKAASPKDLAAIYASDGARIQILKAYDSDNAGKPAPANQAAINLSQNTQQEIAKTSLLPITEPLQLKKERPKFFEIGGVKCKLEDGKMFQEQWVRVDSTKYRLISDTNNKSISMNGKHLETLKWIQIDDGEENG